MVNKGNLAEIEQKIKEAEKFAEEDKKKHELVQLRNQAESMIYQTEKLMKENEAKVGDLKGTIDQKILALKGAVEANDTGRIKTALEDLQNALHQVSQRMYQSTGAGPQAGPTPDQQYQNYQNATESDDAVDVDYEVN